MIYVIAVLLLILVLSNNNARNLLIGLSSIAFSLAVIGALLIALVLGGMWGYKKLFSPHRGQTAAAPPAPVSNTALMAPMSSALAVPANVSHPNNPFDKYKK